MKLTTPSVLMAAAVLAVALPVQADQRHYSIEDRLAWQQNRIEQGLAAGSISQREGRILGREQQEIRALARDYGRDGRLSRDERRTVQAYLDRAAEHIRALEHNDRTRQDRDWNRGADDRRSNARDEPHHRGW